MSTDRGAYLETPDPDPHGQLSDDGEAAGEAPPGLWDWLPRLSLRQVRLEDRLARWKRHEVISHSLTWLEARMGAAIDLGTPEVIWAGSGLERPGLIAQFRRPRLNTRLAFGLEVPLAHAVVDRLLGYDRPLAESRLQLTPVEWGVWTYLVVQALEGNG